MGPESASSAAFEEINALYWVMLAVAAVLFLAANAGLWLALRRRASTNGPRRQRRSAGPLVATGLGLLAAAIFTVGLVYTERTNDRASASSIGAGGTPGEQGSADVEGLSGEGALEVQAVGQQWLWRYQYPDGTFSYYELVLPVGIPVRVEVASTDVLHSWSVPGLARRTDAVPGRPHEVRFTPTKEGLFEGASYQYSGANFATMRTAVRVVSAAAYERWLREQGDGIAAAEAWVEEEISKGGAYGAIERKAAGGGG